jgi:predicted metal-dependent hydrolase
MSTQLNVRIIRSDRRTIALQITPEGEILLRAPRRCSEAQLRRFVEDKRPWLEKHLAQVQQRQQEAQQAGALTMEELRALADRAMEVIPARVAHFAPLVGVSYGRITIRNQRTRWGSCSGKGNLNFNCLLMLAPPEVLDYVVVHELCHRREMNHSPRFWALVEQVLPDWQAQRLWLKEHGDSLMRRRAAAPIRPAGLSR